MSDLPANVPDKRSCSGCGRTVWIDTLAFSTAIYDAKIIIEEALDGVDKDVAMVALAELAVEMAKSIPKIASDDERPECAPLQVSPPPYEGR